MMIVVCSGIDVLMWCTLHHLSIISYENIWALKKNAQVAYKQSAHKSEKRDELRNFIFFSN